MEKLKYIIEDSTIAEVLGVQNFTNEESAILELVKNAYDAQSLDVVIIISKSQIIIEDNGIGMNRQKILGAWMHVGISDKKYIIGAGETARVLAGSKGVGRFAIARLGAKASVYTKMDQQEAVLWKTDWNTNTLETYQEIKERGTKIVIEQLRDNWTESRVRNLREFLSRTYNDMIKYIYILVKEEGTKMDDTNLSIVKVDNIKKFWLSFTTWFEDELPGTGILKAYYEDYDNWNGGIYYLGIDFEKEYRLHYGIDYSDILKLEVPQMEDIKMFIELAFHEWVIFEKRYDFTVMVNKRLSRFSIPYRLQNGRLIQEGYKTSYYLDKILNYSMFERKIRYSEEMITSREYLDKKSALDYIIDALQFILSVQDSEKVILKYKLAAKSVNEDKNSKVYAVVKAEIEEIMKISNEYFDIRHNEYLNKAKQAREPIQDLAFIEYLYNRTYALLYLLRIKTDTGKLINFKKDCDNHISVDQDV